MSTLAANALAYDLANIGSIPVLAREEGHLCTSFFHFQQQSAIGANFQQRSAQRPAKIGLIAEQSSAQQQTSICEFRVCDYYYIGNGICCFRFLKNFTMMSLDASMVSKWFIMKINLPHRMNQGMNQCKKMGNCSMWMYKKKKEAQAIASPFVPCASPQTEDTHFKRSS